MIKTRLTTKRMMLVSLLAVFALIAFSACKGDLGPAGPQGPTGPQGPVGPAGVTGPVGPVGPVGPSGPVGAIGSAGVTGPQGPAGATGLTGAKGELGLRGPDSGAYIEAAPSSVTAGQSFNLLMAGFQPNEWVIVQLVVDKDDTRPLISAMVNTSGALEIAGSSIVNLVPANVKPGIYTVQAKGLMDSAASTFIKVAAAPTPTPVPPTPTAAPK